MSPRGARFSTRLPDDSKARSLEELLRWTLSPLNDLLSVPSVPGIRLGSAAAIIVWRSTVDTIDSSAFLAVALLTAVGMLACAIPAVRATRLQAIEALHQE